MSPLLKQVAILMVLAALPLPILLYAGLTERQHLFWLFLSDLVIVILASKGTRQGRDDDAGPTNRWAFKSRVER